MAWTNSKVFRPFVAAVLGNTAAFDLDADTIKVALYDNDITPDNDVAIANSAYNVDQWVTTGNEVWEVGQWAQGGVTLAGQSLDSSVADVVFFDGTDAASGSAADLANVYGCLVFDSTVSSYGLSYNYFGGANSVVNGTFTVVWHANGIIRFTL